MIAFITLFIAGFSFAVTEEEIRQSVLKHFPLIEEASLKSQASEGDLESAEGSFDHKLKFKMRNWRQQPYNNEYFETLIERQTPYLGAKVVAGHRQGNGYFNFYDLKKETSPAGQAFAGLVLPLLRGRSTDDFRTNLEIAQLNRKAADQNVRVKKLVYVHKALSLYYKWLLQSKKVEIARGLVELAEGRRSMIDKKHKAGAIERLKVIDNDRAIMKRRSEYTEALIALQEITNELSLFYRDQEGKPIKMSEAPDAENLLLAKDPAFTTTILKENPQLQILSYEMRIIEAQKKNFSQARLPGLSVDVTGYRELSERPNYGQNILQFGISFDFPLENRKASGKTVATIYKEKALEKEILYVSQELEQKLNFSISAGTLSRDRWETLEKEFADTNKVVDGERKKWLQGASDLFQVNIREQDLADVEKRRWSALYEYHQHNLDARLFSATLNIN